MVNKASRKQLTADDYKKKLELAKAAIKALEEKAYAGELEELIKSHNLKSIYTKIREKVDRSVTDIAILSAIAKELGMKRMLITQADVKKRAPRKLNT